MKQIKKEEFKKICLDLLVSLDRVCNEYNLRYFLDYGTLLGAVRHKGFIPWDDDIDVMMPRKDYEKLLELFRQNDNLFGAFHKLSFFSNEYNTFKPYINIVDIRTITCSKARKKKYFYPIWIDVFPMDYALDSDDASERITTIKKEITHAWQLTKRIKSFRSAIRYIVEFPTRNKTIKHYDNANSIAKEKENGEIMLNFYSIYRLNDIVSKNYFDGYCKMRFEGYEFRAPLDYDFRLKKLYGDYMKLPPEESRKTHFIDSFWVTEDV